MLPVLYPKALLTKSLSTTGVFDENDNRFFEMPEFIEMSLDQTGLQPSRYLQLRLPGYILYVMYVFLQAIYVQ